MELLLGLALMGGLAILVVNLISARSKADVSWKRIGAMLNDSRPPDYSYQGYTANRVGEPFVRVGVGIYRADREVRFILDPPQRDIRVKFDDLVEVVEGQYEVQGKRKAEVSVVTRCAELPGIQIEAWSRDLFVNLKSVAA